MDTESSEVKSSSDTFTPKPNQYPIFQQFINFDFNDESKLNEAYLVHSCIEPHPSKTMKGWTKLMILLFVSSDTEYERYLQSLCNSKEEVNRKAEYGYTALIIAARHGLTSKCKLLIHNGADLNAKTTWNSTALMFSIEALEFDSNFETFKLLIDSGADINLVSNNNHTTLGYAVDVSHIKAIEYLIAHKVKVPEDLYYSDEKGVRWVDALFQMHIFPRRSWKMNPNFYIAELLLKHTQLEVTQNLLAHVCWSIVNKPDDYIIDVRGLEVLIERGAYLTPEILRMRSDLLKNLCLQAYSNLYDRQRNALRENNITKSIAKEFGNTQESLILATTLCYMNCDNNAALAVS